jgi:hypothetical protein
MLPLTIDPMPIPSQVINLVSNLPPTTTSLPGGIAVKLNQWVRSSFTTDSNFFIFTSVTLRFAQITASNPPDQLIVEIYKDNAGALGDLITSFTNPGSISFISNYIFTLTTPQILAANTTYWLVARVSIGSEEYSWLRTDSTTQTGLTGWSIGDTSLFSDNQGFSWNTFAGFSAFQFSINGQSYSPAAGDPYFPNTSLLLHGNGANNSTNIIDSSSNPKSITATGNARISTDQSRFGGSSILINSGVVFSSSSLDFAFGSGDFTIEGWVYLLSIPSSGFPDLFRTTDNLLYINFRQSGVFAVTTASAIIASSPSAVPLNQWSYFAVTRSGSVFRVWLDGVSGTPATANLTFATNATAIRFGDGNVPLYAYIDEYRITKGVAREITLPTAPFPDL